VIEPLKVRKLLVLMATLSIFAVAVIAWSTPLAIFFALGILAYTFPIFIWLDRLEPEPRTMRWNAFLWGAGISAIVSSIFNDLTTMFLGSTLAALASAPLIEEIMKVCGILSAAKRHQVDSPLDGIIYAGYIGLGFSSVENVIYFSAAISENEFGTSLIARGLLSPFAHPYFTLFAGLYIGKAVLRETPHRAAALKGLLIGLPLHASWNAMVLYPPIRVLMIGHIVLFSVMVVKMTRLRRREIKFVRANVSKLAFTHNLSPIELEIFGDLKATRQARRKLSRLDRRSFDIRRTEIARLLSKMEL